ncbi:hypothetical protein Ahy_A09g045334 [Arachis hypogaea]|uniref:Endonuclease/exonuclease/phosphatase domain-containing protein n=1 Tax=Arachis hypogaea TaxID=3818 RepID=A0A445BM53_ARAHY|nr:hypothetical protein Ahy_A09g045334 [Arachis hypogaea]
MLEPTVRGTDCISQNAYELKKTKIKRIVTAGTRTMIQRMENGEKYFVELAEDQQDMEEDSIAKPQLRNNFMWALELAYNLGIHLNLKKKRDVGINVDYEEEMKESKEMSMQQPGMVAPSTVHELKSICKSLRPSILFFMETKASKSSCDRIRRKLCFDNMFCVESRGLSRGFLYFLENDNDKEWEWEATFVCGHPDYKKRKELWKELTFVSSNLAQPRMLIGDFNDKVSLHSKLSSQIESFRKFVRENAILDLELQGMKYTWFSNPRNGCVTKERLDRVFVNWEWRRAFQHATLSALPPISSDHTPLVLNVNPRGRRSKNFKFETFWVDHADCDTVIRRGWSRSGNTEADHWTNLIRRI